MRKKIRITFPAPEPDPPDEACDLCGHRIAGWRAKLDREEGGRLLLCWDCEYRRADCGPWPRFSRNPEAVWPKIVHRNYSVAAGLLWWLEREANGKSTESRHDRKSW